MNTLVDRFGRRIEYLRLSVTDRCDLRCAYCIPEGFKGFEEPDHWLTFDEIERLIRLFADLGLKRLRLTGGEPLLRKNITDLCRSERNIRGATQPSFQPALHKTPRPIPWLTVVAFPHLAKGVPTRLRTQR